MPCDGRVDVAASPANSIACAAGNISWLLVAVGFVAAIIIGAGILIARSCGVACCQCAACAAFIGRKGSSSASSSPTAVICRPAPSPSKGIMASAFESSAFDPQLGATASPALLGGANSSSGDDSVDFLPAPPGLSSAGPTGAPSRWLRRTAASESLV